MASGGPGTLGPNRRQPYPLASPEGSFEVSNSQRIIKSPISQQNNSYHISSQPVMN